MYLSQQREYLKNLEKEEEDVIERVDSLKSSEYLANSVKLAYQRLENTVRGRRRKADVCQSENCIINLIAKDLKEQEEFQCRSCSLRFHYCCGGVYTPDDSYQAEDGNFICAECSPTQHGPKSLISMQEYNEERCRLIEIALQNDCDLLKHVEKERNTLQNTMTRPVGDLKRQFEQVLSDIKCDGRVWYQSLTGNQARIILRPQNIESILLIFPDSA